MLCELSVRVSREVIQTAQGQGSFQGCKHIARSCCSIPLNTESSSSRVPSKNADLLPEAGEGESASEYQSLIESWAISTFRT